MKFNHPPSPRLRRGRRIDTNESNDPPSQSYGVAGEIRMSNDELMNIDRALINRNPVILGHQFRIKFQHGRSKKCASPALE
jgi:hypothetical protein